MTDTQPAHYSISPGDDLYLTLLMVPYSLDRDRDRKALLAFAHDVWDAATAAAHDPTLRASLGRPDTKKQATHNGNDDRVQRRVVATDGRRYPGQCRLCGQLTVGPRVTIAQGRNAGVYHPECYAATLTPTPQAVPPTE